MFVQWREIGARMGIDFNEPFPNAVESELDLKENGNAGQSLEKLEAWSLAYEVKFMKYHKSNALTGEKTRELLLRPLAPSMKWIGEKAVSALLEDRLRESMGWEKPEQGWITWIPRILKARAWVIKHLFLPRLFYKSYSGAFVVQAKKDGSVHLQRDVYLFEPW